MKNTIKIDRNKCISCATCVTLASKTFKHDKENIAIVKPEPHDKLEDILTAVESCPVGAIKIIDKKEDI